ncbi:LuxR C-terminal-related transcriptional regulator [Demequina muriae]|uniref:LuxR C-terminal-related transcriptional regulator n=1 Tax=Demequina muriae TaxID=3051664 RepID=A0ABT8GHK2_9MICO|nr:LuxR C-terminal-related transcriptional regulator [Demequina sp. EGI L300058]MDN4480900.1 LuxR C-terminal-related transcriptional regulator [Demequina sp. EGI L300058]
MKRPVLTSDDAAHVVTTVDTAGAVLITGPRGIGKSHLLRAAATLVNADGLSPLEVTGSPAAATVPLGAFAGVLREHDGALTPSAVIGSLTRRRSRALLLVDAADLLDESSQMVVGHLVRSAGMKAVLTARELGDCPDELRSLYDSGVMTELNLDRLPDGALSDAIASWLGGPVTPGTLRAVLAAADGNPLVAREIVAGTVATGALHETPHGWELDGPIAATPRLSQLIGAHLDTLEADELDAAASVALAGSLPEAAVADAHRRPLVRAGIVSRDDDGWLHSSQPLLAEAVRARVVDGHWRDLARSTVAALEAAAVQWPDRAAELERRGSVIALEHQLPLEAPRCLDLATHALGAGDPALAFRAADAAAAVESAHHARALRLRGLASSALGRADDADRDLRASLAAGDTDPDIAASALALASHLGLAGRDPRGALAVLADAQDRVLDDEWRGHLERSAVRWTSVAGAGGVEAEAPAEVTEAEAAMGIATMATAAVISGPLHHADALVRRFRALPQAVVAQAPGAAALTELASIMALSYSGDVRATRARLTAQIDLSLRHAPETSGAWEYALGIVELFAADAGQAHERACDAVQHLEWRDPMGLLPAASALRGAAAAGAGLELEAIEAWRGVPEESAMDPKVAVLKSWAEAWDAASARRRTEAGARLREGAAAMITAQHTYFAGKLAHCAIRVGGGDDEALALLAQAHAAAGGGLLAVLLEHGQAMRASDAPQLDALAEDLVELGAVVSAADTWLTLAQQQERFGASELDARRWQVKASALRATVPCMALWQQEQSATGALLSRREYEVASLAVQRLTAKEIASINDVSPHTVTNQLNSAFRKLGVSSRTELREVWAEAGGRSSDYP